MANGTQTVIIKYWPIIAAFAVLAVGYGTNTANLANAESDITDTQARVAAIEKDLGEVKTSIAKIETNQEYTTRDIEGINRSLERIVENLNGE